MLVPAHHVILLQPDSSTASSLLDHLPGQLWLPCLVLQSCRALCLSVFCLSLSLSQCVRACSVSRYCRPYSSQPAVRARADSGCWYAIQYRHSWLKLTSRPSIYHSLSGFSLSDIVTEVVSQSVKWIIDEKRETILLVSGITGANLDNTFFALQLTLQLLNFETTYNIIHRKIEQNLRKWKARCWVAHKRWRGRNWPEDCWCDLNL